MKYFELICTIVFAALTLTLILLKIFKVGNRRRGVIKMLTSTVFLAAAIYGCCIMQTPYCWLLAIGVFFAFLGDLLLVFMDKHSLFIGGVVSFSAASLTLSVYSVLVYGWQWWSVIIFGVMLAANIILQCKKVLSYGHGVVYLNVYTVMVGLCGCLGLSLLCTSSSLGMAMFGLGCFAYMLSDVCLGLYLYKFRSPLIDAVNTALYFPGMFLIAISLIL